VYEVEERMGMAYKSRIHAIYNWFMALWAIPNNKVLRKG
jgi:hypothetical protein